MQLSVTTRPVRIDKWGVRTTIVYDDKAISNMLNRTLGKGSGFLIAFENRYLDVADLYVPYLNGHLAKSARVNTYRGSGQIVWGRSGPSRMYAAKQFYTNSGPPRPTGALRGAFWTTRIANDRHIGRILREISPQFGFRGR